jgi:hypothetical protein
VDDPVEPNIELLAVVEVDRDARVRCQALRCRHSVYKRIHVVKEGADLRVYGSDCFAHLFGHLLPNAKPRHGGSEGRLLSDEERHLLLENTAALLERFEAELRAKEGALDRREPSKHIRHPVAFVPSQPQATDRSKRLSQEQLATVLAEAKAVLREQGLDPELPGWHGVLEYEARTLYWAKWDRRDASGGG